MYLHAMFTSCMHVDIAVGAPFDDGGKVFIYHGSNSTLIIDTTVKQVFITLEIRMLIYYFM